MECVYISLAVAVFPRGPKRGNPIMTRNTVTATRKRRDSTYVEGKIVENRLIEIKSSRMTELMDDILCEV